MMKEQLIINRGFSLVEILIGLAVMAIGVSGALVLISQQQFLASDKEQAVQAQALASEGLEAVRAINQKNWDDLTVGEHGLSFSGGEWQFSGSEDLNGIFARKIIINNLDSRTKQIVSRIEWEDNSNIELLMVLTDWQGIIESGGDPGSGDPGLSGDWSNPQTLISVDIGAGRKGTDVVVENSKVYISSVASDPDKNDLSIYDVSTPSNPVLLGELNTDGKGINSLALSGDELYAASPDNEQEFLIINISNPNSPSVISQLDLGDSKDAISIFYLDDFVYLGRKEGDNIGELVIIDVSNSTNPQVSSVIEIDKDLKDIFVLGQRAYLAVDDDENTLTIFDVSNPALPQEIGDLDIGGQNGRSVFVQTDSRVFLGTDSKFYALDAASSSNISIRGSIDILADINDITVVGNFAFLATSKANSEFITLNATDPTDIQKVSSFNFPQHATGVDYENNLIFVSVRSNDALRIITSQ
ncbi:MAG: beta-propeller domain-containing protein [Candidatus Paceibacterota bacterium]